MEDFPIYDLYFQAKTTYIPVHYYFEALFWILFISSCQEIGLLCLMLVSYFDSFQDQTGHQSPGNSSKGQTRWKGRTFTKKNQSPYRNASSESLWSDIQEFAKIKYKVIVLTFWSCSILEKLGKISLKLNQLIWFIIRFLHMFVLK